MSAFVFLIEQTAVGLYILIAVGIVYFWRRWVSSRRAYRSTTFELERDMARYQSGNAMMMVVLLIQAGLVVAGVQNVVAPTVRADMELQGVTVVETLIGGDGEFVTPTRPAPSGMIPVDPSGVELGGPEIRDVFATPTLTPTPVGTIESAPEPICASEQAQLQIPANGMRVFQPIRVVGIAHTPDFSEYKLEINGPSTLNQYSVIDVGTLPIMEMGTLSQFNPTAYEPGTYLFRLTVFDTSQTLRATCQYTIYITDPIPTATPLGE